MRLARLKIPARGESVLISEREAEKRTNVVLTIVGLLMMAVVVGVLLLNSWMASSIHSGIHP
jgi:hypothetical protein